MAITPLRLLIKHLIRFVCKNSSLGLSLGFTISSSFSCNLSKIETLIVQEYYLLCVLAKIKRRFCVIM